jgi:sugar phosphate isomerase/epimerase
MRVSFSTGTFYHRSLGYSLSLAAESGYDGVELVLGPRLLLHGVEPYRRAIQATGVPVLSVHPPFYPLPGWPRASTQAIPRLATTAHDVGATLAVVHTPFVTTAESPRAARYSNGLQLGNEAGRGVMLGLESSQYNKRTRRYYLDDLVNLTRFAQERGCGVTFDTCHAGANGQDILACYEIVRPALCNVHLSDVVWRRGKPRTHRLPGEGTLPLRAFLSMLARDGYNGLITLEIHPRQAGMLSRVRAVRRLRQAAKFVRDAIAPPGAQMPHGSRPPEEPEEPEAPQTPQAPWTTAG